MQISWIIFVRISGMFSGLKYAGTEFCGNIESSCIVTIVICSASIKFTETTF